MTFGERLALAMDRRGMTQARLAKLVGISRAHVSNWLLGKRELPQGVHIVIALSKVLNVPLAWLVNGEPPEPSFEDELTKPEEHGTRARAVEIVHGEIAPAAIAIVTGEEGERTVYGWIVRMQSIERAIHQESGRETFSKKSQKPSK
jgi:transcriptional regulator with XRE-family HTH domain